jgi:predicted lipid carrier protein YhbT
VMLPRLEPGVHVTATEVDAALEAAAEDPIVLADRKLWDDWLAFLRGASINGGLLVR